MLAIGDGRRRGQCLIGARPHLHRTARGQAAEVGGDQGARRGDLDVADDAQRQRRLGERRRKPGFERGERGRRRLGRRRLPAVRGVGDQQGREAPTGLRIEIGVEPGQRLQPLRLGLGLGLGAPTGIGEVGAQLLQRGFEILGQTGGGEHGAIVGELQPGHARGGAGEHGAQLLLGVLAESGGEESRPGEFAQAGLVRRGRDLKAQRDEHLARLVLGAQQVGARMVGAAELDHAAGNGDVVDDGSCRGAGGIGPACRRHFDRRNLWQAARPGG